jgi:hypothetical protein
MNIRFAWLLVLALTAYTNSYAVSAQQGRRPPPAPMPCVEVRIGQDSAGRLDCLNRALRAEVDEVAPMSVGDVTFGKSQGQLGLVTPAAAKERLGDAYGHSSVPQRPVRTFAPLLAPTH